MILVGIEKCSSCKVARKFLSEIPYIKLRKHSRSDKICLKIKKALRLLNPTKQFPVVLNDSMTAMIGPKFIMSNLEIGKIRNKMESIKNKIKTISFNADDL